MLQNYDVYWKLYGRNTEVEIASATDQVIANDPEAAKEQVRYLVRVKYPTFAEYMDNLKLYIVGTSAVSNIELAKVGYEAYGQKAEWQTYDHRVMPQWDAIGAVQERWIAAAEAIRNALL